MIDVALTRADLRDTDVAVVIDVLRATSTVAQALAAGYHRVLCTETIELALALRGPGRVLAAERQCLKPPGFDQGNSPGEARDRRGDELVLATTNGAPAIVAAAQHAPRVLLACVLNLDAAVTSLRSAEQRGELGIQIVCAGTSGAVALDDLYVAGRLASALPGPRTDAALVAESVARGFQTPLDALAASASATALSRAGLTDDIAYCALESELDVTPVVIAIDSGVATVAAPDGSIPAHRITGAMAT